MSNNCLGILPLNKRLNKYQQKKRVEDMEKPENKERRNTFVSGMQGRIQANKLNREKRQLVKYSKKNKKAKMVVPNSEAGDG